MTAGRWVLFAALAAVAAVASDGGPSRAAGSAGPEFVMPSHGGFIAGGTVIVAGRTPSEAGPLTLLLDGSPVEGVVREGRAFRAVLTPGRGRHVVEAQAGGRSATIAFFFGERVPGRSPFRYHRPVLEGRCAECHAGVRRSGMNAEAQTCRSCHRRMNIVFPHVHGPVAAGKCLVCHDPHGSELAALTKADPRTLCTSCHDQPTTMEHVERARSRVCHLCHNPHASMNPKLLYDIVQ